jgi:hypothetical protein
MAERLSERRRDYPTDLPGGPDTSFVPVDEREMFKRDDLAGARSKAQHDRDD